jgi:hypothetical protein
MIGRVANLLYPSFDADFALVSLALEPIDPPGPSESYAESDEYHVAVLFNCRPDPWSCISSLPSPIYQKPIAFVRG